MSLEDRIAQLSRDYLAAFFRHDYTRATELARELDAARAERMAVTGLPVAS